VKHDYDVHQETKAYVKNEDVANIEVYFAIWDEVSEEKQLKWDEHDHVFVKEFHATLSERDVWFYGTKEH